MALCPQVHTERVLHEALYAKHDRMRYVFVRDWNEKDKAYDVKQQDFGLLPVEAKKVRPNASLIATAAQYGVPLAQRMVVGGIQTNIYQFGRHLYDSQQLLKLPRTLLKKLNTMHGLSSCCAVGILVSRMLKSDWWKVCNLMAASKHSGCPSASINQKRTRHLNCLS